MRRKYLIETIDSQLRLTAFWLVFQGVVTLVPDTYLTADEKRSMRLKQYINCPGTCIPVPYTEIPVSIVEVWLKMDGWKLWPVSQQKYSGDLMVSCSLSLEVL